MPNAPQLAAALEPWFERAQRDLAWRRTRDPYAIWVSEIMLQQTRVETVERYYPDFLARFPRVGDLAAADESDVVGAWSGLGYYRRARLLHRGARYVRDAHAGELPRDAESLRRIPGIGPYTAGAIASIAYDRPEPLVDGNVARVLSRLDAIEDPALQGAGARSHWALARAILEQGSPRLLAQALMELGATVCTPRSPQCEACPVADLCRAHARGLTDSIPAPRKRVEQPLETWAALAIESRRRLLLVRRPDEGILAGMWCLPLCETSRSGKARPAAVRQWLGARPDLEPGGRVRHVFTHRIWDLRVFRGRLLHRPELPDAAWIAPGERPPGGIPSVTEKLLASVDY